MPHVTIEYSANLGPGVDMNDICRVVHAQMMQSSLFELGAVRVRALKAEAFAIADQLPENAFVDVSIRMGVGRSTEDRKKLGDAVFAGLSAALAGQLATTSFALSLEIREISADLSWKKNSMHARLRGK